MMGYDPEKDAAALADELNNDPDGIGYAAALASNDYNALRDLLAERRNQYSVFRASVPMGDVYGAVDWDGDFLNLSAEQRDAFRLVTSTDTLDAVSQNIQDVFTSFFPGGSETRTALLELVQRDASRAEDLFGVGTVITSTDIQTAL